MSKLTVGTLKGYLSYIPDSWDSEKIVETLSKLKLTGWTKASGIRAALGIKGTDAEAAQKLLLEDIIGKDASSGLFKGDARAAIEFLEQHGDKAPLKDMVLTKEGFDGIKAYIEKHLPQKDSKLTTESKNQIAFADANLKDADQNEVSQTTPSAAPAIEPSV